MFRTLARALALSLFALGPVACSDGQGAPPSPEAAHETQQALRVELGPRALAYDYAHFEQIPAGVAGGKDVVFVGSPLEGRVRALSRFDARELGELPPPANGFVLPFIIKAIAPNRIAVLDAGGLPSPAPFVPANPVIYEYEYAWAPRTGFSAELVKAIHFDGVLVGFPEDIVKLDSGSYLMSDAILGSIWIAEADGTIRPGIVPEAFDAEHAIPKLAFCPSMPLIQVEGIPFLFSGSTLPGVSPLAVRDGTLYFYSPCAEGLYALPLASLFDDRPPAARAADIRLVSAKPANIPVEQLLGITFDPFEPSSHYLYAADSLQLRVIRVDVTTGARQIVADDPKLFNFPSSMGFLPPIAGVSPLVVVSNQQHRTTLLNDALDEDRVQLPFIAAKVYPFSEWR